MQIENTKIDGLKIIHLKRIIDERGCFVKIYNEEFFIENHINFRIRESYYSVSDKNVIRGMHFQLPPFEHDKVIFVNQGNILDVILDIRKSSPTYGEYFSIELNSVNPQLIFVPVGCAHGFLCLKDNSIVSYLQSSVYDINCDSGILWNSFKMEWNIDYPILSGRDNTHVNFKNFISPF